MALEEKTCLSCGDPFRPYNVTQTLCMLCRGRVQRPGIAEEQSKPRRMCRACGKPLPASRWLYHERCTPEVTGYGPVDYGTGVLV